MLFNKAAGPVAAALLGGMSLPASGQEFEQLTDQYMTACLSFVLKGDQSQLQDEFTIPEDVQRVIDAYGSIPGLAMHKITYLHPTHNLSVLADAGGHANWECTVGAYLDDAMIAMFGEKHRAQVLGDRLPTPSAAMADAAQNWIDEHAAAYDFEPWPEAIALGRMGAHVSNTLSVHRRCVDELATALVVKEGRSPLDELATDLPVKEGRSPVDVETRFWNVALMTYRFDADEEQAEFAALICDPGTS
ncbi:hypothetical protein [Paracoccus xiamenensis]|uniref:hypothetical protein n=1 Tax=Paracoccus xiamenensis TaxID=2714901 RepID=UPI001408867D|nr:hypothetical protein [Paracoccus xiamenensis]NHF72804.1 hypothetical protein [Paracoccus xiamenensis]